MALSAARKLNFISSSHFGNSFVLDSVIANSALAEMQSRRIKMFLNEPKRIQKDMATFSSDVNATCR